jgi:hypothetical protein
MTYSLKSKFTLPLVAAALIIAFAPRSEAQNVQRWVHPGYAELDSTAYNYENNYATALAGSDVFQFFLEDVANLGYSRANCPNEATLCDNVDGRNKLVARIQIFKRHGTRISIADRGPNGPEGYAWNPSYSTSHYCEFLQGGCTDNESDAVAQQTAIKTLWKIQPIYDAGVAAGLTPDEVNKLVGYIEIDGAGIVETLENGYGVGATGVGGHMSLGQSAATLVSYMRYIHRGFPEYNLAGRPEIKFGLVIAMPNVNYQGTPSIYGWDNASLARLDFYNVLNTIVDAVNQGATPETLWFLHADSPYSYTFDHAPATSDNDYLGRLVWLRNQARSLNLRFGMIFNTDWPSNNAGTNQRYTEDTLAYIRAYRSRTNWEDPDDFIVENWQGDPDCAPGITPCYHTPYPDATFPESTDYTFMNLVKKIADPANSDVFWGYDHRYFRQLDGDIFNWQDYLAHDGVLAQWVTQTFPGHERFGAEWHWLNSGVGEGRRGSYLFSSQYYAASNPDVMAPPYSPNDYPHAIDHYFVSGRNEGRPGTDPNCPGCW